MDVVDSAPRISPKNVLSAPSSNTCAETYGISGASSDRPGTLTTQNVVTTPLSCTSTSTVVGSPVRGSVPRDAAYTSVAPSAWPPTILPRAKPFKYIVVATPAVTSKSKRIGTVMPVTGWSSTAPAPIGAGVGSSPSPSEYHDSMSVMWPVRSARQRAVTRCPTAIASSVPQSTTCRIAVSAPSGRISANANGFESGCLPGFGSATHVYAWTIPHGPTWIQWSPSGATAALVVGSYSVGGTSTRPSASRTASMRPSRRPVRNRPMTGPTERV